MKREIKFRAWDLKRKEMFYVNSLNSYADRNDAKPLEVRRYQGDMPEDFHLMQFTGLKDKNGVEIYEGDVIQNISNEGKRLSIFQIVWNESNSSYMKKRLDDYTMFHIDHPLKFAEVFGNIHQNPELLTP